MYFAWVIRSQNRCSKNGLTIGFLYLHYCRISSILGFLPIENNISLFFSFVIKDLDFCNMFESSLRVTRISSCFVSSLADQPHDAFMIPKSSSTFPCRMSLFLVASKFRIIHGVWYCFFCLMSHSRIFHSCRDQWRATNFDLCACGCMWEGSL